MNKLKDMVADGKKVIFQYYRKGELWYATECGFNFPVPIEDTGEAFFKNEDRALYFMRWIMRHIKFLEKAKEA
jgi:hypothetical protein